MAVSADSANLARFWINHDPNLNIVLAPQVLLDEQGSFILTTILATWIAIWSCQYWKLLGGSFAILGLSHRNTERTATTSSNLYKIREGFGVVFDERTAEEGFFRVFFEVLEKYEVLRVVQKWFCGIFKKRTTQQGLRPVKDSSADSPQNPSAPGKFIVPVLLVFCAFIFGCITLASIAAGFLVQDNNAISARQGCRMWKNLTQNAIYNLRPEIMESVEGYYRACYENDPSVQACDLFTDKDLHVTNTTGVKCPFKGNVCLLGPNSAISWNTTLRDSIDIGINSRHRPFLQKETICSPLVTEGYYSAVSNTSMNSTTFNFQYGNNSTSNITFTHHRSEFFENLYSPSGYEIKTVSETSGQFQPIEALTSDSGYTFLAFINTFSLEYPAQSTDPLFPADTPTPCTTTIAITTGADQTCWKDSTLPARVLGCTESAKVCSPSGAHCYDAFDPSAYQDLKAATWPGAAPTLLLWFALSYSDFGNTLATRHGFLLEATRRITGNRASAALDPLQWQLEARRLFDMSLLRAKYEMLYVVRGSAADRPGEMDILPPQWSREACDAFAFQAQGHRNVSLVGVVLAFCLPVLLGLEIEGRPPVVWLLLGVRKLARRAWAAWRSVVGAIRAALLCVLPTRLGPALQRRTDMVTAPEAKSSPRLTARETVAPRVEVSSANDVAEPIGFELQERKDVSSTSVEDLEIERN